MEETELASFLVYVAKAGSGKSRGEIKQISENVAREKKFLKYKDIRWMVQKVHGETI